MIDLQADDEDISQWLDGTLHAPIVPTSLESYISEEHNADLSEVEVHDAPCQYFVCQRDPHYKQMEQLVKSLSWKFEEHAVCPGSLLLFSVPSRAGLTDSVQHPRILGVSVKKPKCHMLLRVALEHDQVSLTTSESNVPEFDTSHELLLGLLRSCAASPEVVFLVNVEVWECNAFLEPNTSDYNLKSDPNKQMCKFTISSEIRQKTKQVNVKLPFGVDKMFRKPRKSQLKKKSTVKKTRAASSTAKQKRSVKDTPAQSSRPNIEPEEEVSDIDMEKSSESSDEENQDNINIEEQGNININKEEEKVVPMSSTVAFEEKQIAPLAEEVSQTDKERSEAAQALSSKLETPRGSSSFFSKELGLSDAAVAISGRSMCVHCRTKIPVNSVRFCWFHSKVRPSSWCHSHCLYALTLASGLKSQVVPKLREIIEQQSEAHVDNKVVNDAKSILCALESQN